MSAVASKLNQEPFHRPDTYACIVYRIADAVPHASRNVIATLKAHRDWHLARHPAGVKTVEAYYQATTELVARFEACADQAAVAREAWTHLEKTAAFITQGQNEEAARAFAGFIAHMETC